MFFNAPWVSDMLDVSNGAGSWNLSMNQGLAHMQANLYMNSCWSSGFTFRPYDNLSMMSYLLNPAYASWQAINGISSNNNSIFGNFNNFNNSFNPWGNFSNVGGGSGSGSSNLTSEEEKHKTKCADLERFLKAYKEYQKGRNSLDRDWANDLDGVLNKSIDSDYTYAKKLEDLQTICNGIDSTNMKNFLLEGGLDITGESLFLKELLIQSGFDLSALPQKEVTDVADNIKKRLAEISGENENFAVFDDVSTDFNKNNEYLLAIISYYNNNCTSDNLMADINSKWTVVKDDKKVNVANAMNKVAKALTDRATLLKSQYNEETQTLIDSYISRLAGGLNEKSTDSARNTFVDNFNKLYQILRYAAVKKAEAIFKNTYGEIADKTGLFGTDVNSLTEQTKTDLAGENLDTAVGPTDIGKIGVSSAPKDEINRENLNANKGSDSSSGTNTNANTNTNTNTRPEAEQKALDVDHTVKASPIGDELVDGKHVYIWQDETKNNVNEGDLCILDSNGDPHPLDDPQKLEYGTKIASRTLSVVGGKTVYEWNGPVNYQGVTEGGLCIIENNKPRLFNEDEKIEWVLQNPYTKNEKINDAEGNEKTVYYWTLKQPSVSLDLVWGKPYVLDVNGKPRKLTNAEEEQVPGLVEVES